MYRIAKLPDNEKQELIIATARKMNLPEAIIEKDLWVCIVLDYLFHTSRWKNAFAFKGGTSLSKVYNIIERFSEDIDLILDWRVLGYETYEPWEKRSNTKQQQFLDDANSRLFSFLSDDFLPVFRQELSEIAGREINAYITDNDAGTVRFQYPNAFSDASILGEIRLEIGALAAWTPTQIATVTPYAAEYYPGVFTKTGTEVLTTTAVRTFWEKATILHQEALRPAGSKVPDRYSRHIYDLYCMSISQIKDEALRDTALLKEVARFKARFYPRNWARYDLAENPKTLKLTPAENSLPAFKEDYKKMRAMIFGTYPSFESMLEQIARLEKEINSLDA